MIQNNVSHQVKSSITPELYSQIRRLWMAHSIAEDRRDIPGLIATLSEDCLYEYVLTGDLWRGHRGAAHFYKQLLNSFPDIHFALQNIVIGPQGVFEEAHVTATHQEDWLIYPAAGGPIEFDVLIYFPWDAQAEKFGGERIYAFNLGT